MKLLLKQKLVSSFSFQRNVMAGLSVVLLIVVVLQTLLLFFKSEKIIIHPPEIKESYWVEGNRFAPSYLEEMAAYFAHLLLDVTETSFPYQSEIVLRSVDSRAYGHFKTGSSGYAIGRLLLDPYSSMLYSTKAEDYSAVQALNAQGLGMKEAIEKVLDERKGHA